jgi:topoisomerase IA-like protein
MQLSDAATGQSSEAAAGDGVLGTDPETGEEVHLKSGRFGPYVQLGEGKEPKRSSLPKGWEAASLTLEAALKLLSLPREVGLHPETGLPISAGIGRYGPFVLHDGKYANLPDVEEVWQVGLNRAVDLIAQKAAGGGQASAECRAGPPAAIQTFEHDDGPITVRAGRYGPYVNQGKVNATYAQGPQARGRDPRTGGRMDRRPRRGNRHQGQEVSGEEGCSQEAGGKDCCQKACRQEGRAEKDREGRRRTVLGKAGDLHGRQTRRGQHQDRPPR